VAARRATFRIWLTSGVALVVTIGIVLSVLGLARLRHREAVRSDLSRLSSVGRVLRDDLCVAKSRAIESRLEAYISELKRSSLDKHLVASEELAMRAFYAYGLSSNDGRPDGSSEWDALTARCKELQGTVCTADSYRRYAASVCARSEAVRKTSK